MEDKPNDPHSAIAKKILKKILPNRIYQANFGRHENGSMKLWSHFATQIEAEFAIFDVGAFHGEYSIAARARNPLVKIVAFEPNPESADQLRLSMARYNIVIEEVALSSTNGFSSFEKSSSTSHLLEHTGSVQVQTVKLDDYCHKNKSMPGLMKIDTEGSESQILFAGKGVLEKCKPVILCEILSNSAGGKVMEILPADYLYYHIDENKGIAEAKIVDRKEWRNMNWLFLPESKLSMLETFNWNSQK